MQGCRDRTAYMQTPLLAGRWQRARTRSLADSLSHGGSRPGNRSTVGLRETALRAHPGPLCWVEGFLGSHTSSTIQDAVRRGPDDPGRPSGAAPVRFGSVPHWSSGDPGGHERYDEYNERQVTAPSRPEPRSLEHGRRGFESHLPSHRAAKSTTPGVSGLHIRPPCHEVQQPPSCAWFEHAACSGTDIPVTRDSPSIATRGSLVGGSRPGSPFQPRSARWSAVAPRGGACLVHVWSTRHRSRAVPNGHRRYVVRAGRGNDPGETGPGGEP